MSWPQSDKLQHKDRCLKGSPDNSSGKHSLHISHGSELRKLNSNLNVKIKYSVVDKILPDGGWLTPHYNFFFLTKLAKMLLVFPLLCFIKIKQSYQQNNTLRTNHTTNHFGYARKTFLCRRTITQRKGPTQPTLEYIMCGVTLWAQHIPANKAVSNEVVLKLEASALMQCPTPNNLPY